MKHLQIVVLFIGLVGSAICTADDGVMVIKDSTLITTIDKLPIIRASRIMLRPGNKSIVIQGLRQSKGKGFALNENLFLVDAKTGKVTRTLADEPTQNVGPTNRQASLSVDGKHVLYHGPRMRTITRFSLDEEKTQTFQVPEKNQGIWSFQLTADGKSMMGVLARPPAAIKWNLESGKQIAYHPIVVNKEVKTRFFTTVKGTNLICIFSPGSDDGKTKFTFYDTKEKRVTMQKELPGSFLTGPSPAVDSEQVMLFRPTSKLDNRLHSIDFIELKTLKTIKTIQLDETISAIHLRRAGKDGRYLFMLADLVQCVYVMDLKDGKLLGVVAPGGGSVAVYDVSTDGTHMAALHVPLSQRTLPMVRLSLVDLTSLYEKK